MFVKMRIGKMERKKQYEWSEIPWQKWRIKRIRRTKKLLRQALTQRCNRRTSKRHHRDRRSAQADINRGILCIIRTCMTCAIRSRGDGDDRRRGFPRDDRSHHHPSSETVTRSRRSWCQPSDGLSGESWESSPPHQRSMHRMVSATAKRNDPALSGNATWAAAVPAVSRMRMLHALCDRWLHRMTESGSLVAISNRDGQPDHP